MFDPRRSLHLVRSLFPRWSFFDRVAYDLDFDVNVRGQENWQRVSFVVERPAFGLFINPTVALALAQQSLVEQFIQDLLTNSPSIEEQSSYKMMLSLGRLWARADEFQFKVVARQAGKVVAMYASTWLSVTA